MFEKAEEFLLDSFVVSLIFQSGFPTPEPVLNAYKLLLDYDLVAGIDGKYSALIDHVSTAPYWLGLPSINVGDRDQYMHLIGDAVIALGSNPERYSIEAAGREIFASVIELIADSTDSGEDLIQYMPAVYPDLVSHILKPDSHGSVKTENGVKNFFEIMDILKANGVPYSVIPYIIDRQRPKSWEFSYMDPEDVRRIPAAITSDYVRARRIVLENRGFVGEQWHDLDKLLVSRRTEISSNTNSEILVFASRINEEIDSLIAKSRSSYILDSILQSNQSIITLREEIIAALPQS
jgi:hypothetical protein